jgi:hypothetical protein
LAVKKVDWQDGKIPLGTNHCCGFGSAWIYIEFDWLDPDPGGQK